MKRKIQAVADGTAIEGVVVEQTGESVTIKLVSPEAYTCTASCTLGDGNDTAAELLKSLYLMADCMAAIVRNDAPRRTSLKVALHHADSRVKRIEQSLAIAERLLHSEAVSHDDAKQLYSTLKGEWLHCQSERVERFNDFFSDCLTRWQFLTIPHCVEQQL